MNLAAWRGMDGGYYPNGSFGREGLWLGTRFDNFILETHRPTDYYKLGIAAYIADKTTYTRASGAKVVYKRVSVHNMDDDSYLRKLNSFCGLSPHAPGQSGMQEMPYSEQAAKFFYDVMIGLCALADKVATFLDNKEILAIAIEKQALLLPDHKEI
ncbi:MAG: hypothetical protein CSYNP_02807 [Syntrophus sp. SKADARSKE-3]|nr:hypothetical protein [Syntrophus sp. SKADARSKE-3]